ncbi:tRNA1(Val) (adenine(37)-N6)-methyltransferase [Sporanaerobacter acetigenes]|uniref:Methyltransferase small domain-containing protein n=1 Tax=Sporanaerobacter acetigenes DSM 13106 TaxID=1123281 RepID=A0A1M5VN52_9FIRM|nr:tRNA1(Val) (adenine(37)-N6)-methyltransferase [Sporanaerobacter acetigenes]SHH76681.1 Methyltransferase small domain-containing protein [Sporanaerobacter acetigenes DSM 13106]
METILRDGEKIDIIPGSNYKIIQNRGKFSYGTDAILLSNFSKIKIDSTGLDLGTGTGIIPLFLCSRYSPKKVYGIEIQEEVADMASRSVKMNNLGEQIEILNMDLKNLPEIFKSGQFQFVTSNPPYMKGGGGIVNERDNFAISRHEIACSLEDIVRTASYLLCQGGKFFMVHRPHRLVDIIWLLRKYNLEPKSIQFVHPKYDEKPNILLIMSMKGGKSELKFQKPLYVYNHDGTYTDEIYKIYGMDVENKNG